MLPNPITLWNIYVCIRIIHVIYITHYWITCIRMMITISYVWLITHIYDPIYDPIYGKKSSDVIINNIDINKCD